MIMLDSPTPPAEEPAAEYDGDPVGREMRMAAARERRAQVLAEQRAAYFEEIPPATDGGRWQVAAALALGLVVGVGTVMVARTLAYRDLPPPARVGMVPAPKPSPQPATQQPTPTIAPPATATLATTAGGMTVAPVAVDTPVAPAPATGSDALRPLPRPASHVVPPRPAAASTAETPGRPAAPAARTTRPAPAKGTAAEGSPPPGSLGRAIAGITALTIGKAAEAIGVRGRPRSD